jgi:CRISPR-associated protein Cst2
MTMHLFGTILTPQAVAHNNRGESEAGTVSTLQKVIRNGDIYSTFSSESIRYAVREGWLADSELKLNRKVGQAAVNSDGSDSTWTDKKFEKPQQFIDDDVLGFMDANAQRNRRGILEISRAVSTTPWPGTISPHFASPGSNVAVGPNTKTKQYEPIPYQCEVHDTRYQYTFALTPVALLKDKKARTEKTLLAIQNLRRPAGNHARFLFDFAPEAVVLRWTPDPAPRIMFCFEQGEDGRLSLAKLVARVRGGDIDPTELVVGTAESIDGLGQLRELGVTVHDGVKKAFAGILTRVGKDITD